MANYRLYCVSGSGRISSAEWIDAKSDDGALILARAKKITVNCELWDGNRLVAEIAAYRLLAAEENKPDR